MSIFYLNRHPAIKRCSPIVFIFLMLSGVIHSCAPFSPEKRVPERDMVPATYSNGASAGNILHRWWESFGDAQLNSLIETALENNYSLKQSWARLDQARALAARSGADLFPSLSMNSGVTAGRGQTTNGTTTTTNVERYSVGLSSSFEIDLWGRIRSERQAAVLSVAASEHDLNTAALTLTANVASRWAGILSQRMQKSLLERQLKANETLVELIELRFRKSLATALDVFQQRQLVEQSRAQIPLVERGERQLLNELALLLGRTPYEIPQITSHAFAIPADIPATGIPVQLLTARPDIQAAMERLAAADWNVAAARADRLPNLRLTASAAYQAEDLNLLWDNWLINLVGDLTAPLLDGGRRKAEVHRLKAVVEENLAAYRQTVLQAVQEVENALVGEQKLRAHLKGLEAQLTAAQSTLNEARSRYRSGLIDYLPVLTQLLTVQNLERTIIQQRGELFVARIALHNSLGGTLFQNPEDVRSRVAKGSQ